MMNEKILVVDDEEDILELIRYNLHREGFEVTCADSGEQALEILKTNNIDLMVLDLMLPGIDGLAITKHLKGSPIFNHIPIVMLTAKDKESDVVAGLEVGAEDYITKPFSPTILAARLRNVLRRQVAADNDEDSVLRFEDLTINMRKHVVMLQDQPVSTTYTEFYVLALLASRPGWVFSRSQIVDAVRGTNHSVTDRSVDVHIVGLRRKLGNCSHYIETVRGIGYRFIDMNANN